MADQSLEYNANPSILGSFLLDESYLSWTNYECFKRTESNQFASAVVGIKHHAISHLGLLHSYIHRGGLLESDWGHILAGLGRKAMDDRDGART